MPTITPGDIPATGVAWFEVAVTPQSEGFERAVLLRDVGVVVRERDCRRGAVRPCGKKQGLGVLEQVHRSGGATVRIYPRFILGVQI